MDSCPSEEKSPTPAQEMQLAIVRFYVAMETAADAFADCLGALARSLDASFARPTSGIVSPDEVRKADAMPPRPATGHSRKAPPPKCWSPERRELVKQLYPAGISVGEILRRVNALPGPPVASPKAVLIFAGNRLRLHRPPDWGARTLAKARSRLPGSHEPPPPPLPRPAPVPPMAAAPTQLAHPLPAEPAPDANGFVVVSFAAIRDWAERFCIRYDGTNIGLVNKMRARLRRPPFSQKGP